MHGKRISEGVGVNGPTVVNQLAKIWIFDASKPTLDCKKQTASRKKPLSTIEARIYPPLAFRWLGKETPSHGE